MYETVHTGLPVSSTASPAITSCAALKPNIFQCAVQAGKITPQRLTAASRFHNRFPTTGSMIASMTKPADPARRFYSEDDFPMSSCSPRGDAGAALDPDYLLIHPMGWTIPARIGADTPYTQPGHQPGCDPGLLIPEWLERGYTVLVTGDHGINADGAHGGTAPDVREVPFFLIGPDCRAPVTPAHRLPSAVRSTICRLLGLPISDTMKGQPLLGKYPQFRKLPLLFLNFVKFV
jgi:hypothetical protein